jgi:hypothetical protein
VDNLDSFLFLLFDDILLLDFAIRVAYLIERLKWPMDIPHIPFMKF